MSTARMTISATIFINLFLFSFFPLFLSMSMSSLGSGSEAWPSFRSLCDMRSPSFF